MKYVLYVNTANLTQNQMKDKLNDFENKMKEFIDPIDRLLIIPTTARETEIIVLPE